MHSNNFTSVVASYVTVHQTIHPDTIICPLGWLDWLISLLSHLCLFSPSWNGNGGRDTSLMCRLGSLSGSKMKQVGRKRTINETDEKTLREALAIPCVSEDKVQQIWNLARRDIAPERQVGKKCLENVSKRRILSVSDCFSAVQLAGLDVKPEPVLVWRCVATLQWLCDSSVVWRDAVRFAHEQYGGLLTPIYYHDEITCGNILTVLKRKKITAVYLAFREMREHLHKEAAWISCAVIQHLHCDTISSGLSAVMKAIVLATQSNENLRGFELQLGPDKLAFRIAKQGLFLSDQDAQRGTWCSKGSAGLKPCQFCANVVKKHCCEHSERFHSIASSDFDAFERIKDADIWEAYKHMATLSKKERQEWEKAYGFNYMNRMVCWVNQLPGMPCPRRERSMILCIVISATVLPVTKSFKLWPPWITSVVN